MRKPKRRYQRTAALFLAAVLLGNTMDLSTVTAYAAQESEQNVSESVSDNCFEESSVSENRIEIQDQAIVLKSDTQSVISTVELPNNEELFAAYADKMFYGGMTLYGRAAREQLGEGTVAQKLYDALKSHIESIATGTQGATTFAIDLEALGAKAEYTNTDLGVSSIWDTNDSSALAADATNAVSTAFWGQFNMKAVMDALMHDCPYELYWYDKTVGAEYGSNIGAYPSTETISVMNPYIYFSVAGNYQGENYSAVAPTVNTTVTGATSAAVTNAQAIVTANASNSDYDKLVAYRDEICGLVAYNEEAVEESYSGGYGDPWQLIYVFDRDNTTDVVCEGYSKAFQYLCDLTTFADSNVACYTVSGMMGGGTGAGAHMWNIVTMEDGKNYLADVTNSDTGTVGFDGSLFLAGTSGSIAEGYTFGTVTFTYDVETTSLWGNGDDSILKLAAQMYTEPEETPVKLPTTLTVDGISVIAYGELGTTSGTGWSYDSNTSTLTLNNANITNYTFSGNGIYFEDGDLTINLIGENTVGDDGHSISFVADSDERVLTITGDGSLTLTGNLYNVPSTGKAKINIIGTTLTTSDILGLGDVTIIDSTVIADGAGWAGIYSEADVTITNSYVVAKSDGTSGGGAGIQVNGSLTITDSQVEALGPSGDIANASYRIYTDSVVTTGMDTTVSGRVTLKEELIVESGETINLEAGASITNTDKLIVEEGVTVIVGGETHTHNTDGGITYISVDETNHTKTAVCKDCPIGYVAETAEAHNGSDATCFVGAVCEICDTTYTAPLGHSYIYTASDVTINEACANGCDHAKSITLNVPQNAVYDGNAKTATISGELSGVSMPTVAYKVKGGSDLTEAPSDAGTYIASINVNGTTVEAEFTIEKTNPNYTVPTGLTATYGDMLSSVLLPANFSWKDGNQVVGDCGANTFVAIFTPEDNNYKSVEVTVSVEVQKVDVTYSAPTAKTGLEYNGSNQALITAGIANGGSMQYSLNNQNWSGDIPTGKDAGEYTVYYKVVGDGNHNDSEVGTMEVTISKIDAEITVGTASYDKNFGDGAFALEVTDTNTEANVQYTVTAGEDVISVSNGTVTIKKVGTAIITVSLPASTNYNAAESKTITVNVAKKSGFTVEALNKQYLYLKENADSINLAALLPADCGSINYGMPATSGTVNYSVEPTISNGVLTFTVNAGAVNNDGTIEVIATTDNYTNITITIKVKLTDQIPVSLKEGTQVSLKSSTLTYGEELSQLVFNNAVFVGSDGKEVTGTLAWKNAALKPDVGSLSAIWVFVPDSEEYASLEDVIAITVKKATPVVSMVPTVADRIYHPATFLANNDLAGGTVKGVDGNALSGTWSWQSAGIVPTADNKGYVAVFTPEDSTNYEAVTQNITVKVAKATPVVGRMPVASVVTYGEMLGTSVLNDGSIQYSTTDTTAVAGSFAWKDSTVKPTVSDGDSTPYTVVFTPTDSANYNGVTFTVTVPVNKAEKAPNMPAGILSVEYAMKQVAEITLPDGWAWQEADKAILLEVETPITVKAIYTGADKGNYKTVEVEITITRSACEHNYVGVITKQPTTEEEGIRTYTCSECNDSYTIAIDKLPKDTPFIRDETDKYGWEVITDEMKNAESGDDITVEMNGATVVPGEVFCDFKGKDVTMILDMGDDIAWKVNGTEIEADKVADINFEVMVGTKEKPLNNIPADVVNSVCDDKYFMDISLTYDGEFGFTAVLTLNVGNKNAGMFANLFYYNEQTGKPEFMCADQVAKDGTAELTFTHASEYIVVVAEASMAPAPNNGNGVTGQIGGHVSSTAKSEAVVSPKTGDETEMWTYYIWLLIAVTTGGLGVLKLAKKRMRIR